MEIVRLATVLGLFLVKALSILAILYIPMIIGAKWLPKIDNKGLFLQPAAWMLPLLAGVLAGLSLINYNLDPDYFTVNNLFRTDGPWALSWTAFITDRVNPFNYSFDPVFAHLSGQGEGADLTFVLAVAALSLVLMVVKAWLSWRSAGALRGILFGLALAIWACYLTIFAVCLTAWLLNQLNFWTLAVVTIMVHLHRSHTLPIHVSTLMAPVAMAVGGHGHGHGHGHGGHGHGHGGHNGHGHNGHGHGHGGHGHGGHGHHVPDEDREVDLPDGLTHSLT